jgi:hypothetical protein
MPNQLELIKTVFHSDYLDESKQLYEKDTDSKGISFEMTRKIQHHHGIDYVLYRFDPNKKEFFPYFSNESGLKKICDYILFAEEGKYLYVILLELKKGTESAQTQLLASEGFMNFVLASAKRIGITFSEHIQTIKVRVSEERAKKRNRSTKPSGLKKDENGIVNYDHSDIFRIKEVIATAFK